MGDGTFSLVGYEVVSRKAATDDGSRSKAEVDVEVGGEVLRGTGAGFGPVDALQAALRSALVPAFPVLDDVVLVDFESGLASSPGDGSAPVQVTVTARSAEVGSFGGVGVAGDLLHASWLAVGDAFGQVVAASSAALVAREYPTVFSLRLAPDDDGVLERLASIDWTTTVLDVESKEDRWFAAQAVELGATVLYSFGNFCAMAGHPHIESIRRINLQKGRPINQVGSLTTTRPHFESLYDWDALPSGLSQDVVLAMFDAFFEVGPMGFRGPAAWSVSQQLTSFDGEVKTTQLVAPGYRCPSNRLVDQALGFIGRSYLFATSANVSSGVTGQVEPAHYEMSGIQRDFGEEEGVVLIGVSDEAAVRASYPRHLPMSTSILSFHKVVEGALVLERLGSFDVADVREIVSSFGFGLVVGPGAQERLPARA